MKGEEGENFGFACWWVGTGRATSGTGRANFLEFWGFWLGWVRHDHATTDTGLAKLLVMLGSIFFIFSHCVGQVPTK